MPIRAKHGSHWCSDKLRQSIYERDNFICAYCQQMTEGGRGPLGRSLDHIVPKSKGGSNLAVNLVCAHIRCNSSRKNDVLDALTYRRFLSIASQPITIENRVAA